MKGFLKKNTPGATRLELPIIQVGVVMMVVCGSRVVVVVLVVKLQITI
jgi:hypothetical protein